MHRRRADAGAGVLDRAQSWLGGFGLRVFVSGWIFRWLVKLQWSAFRAANKQTADFRFGGEGVTSVDAEGASSLVSWEQFTRWSEGARMILLFRSPHLWLMVPKRLLREKQLDALRAMLKDRVG